MNPRYADRKDRFLELVRAICAWEGTEQGLDRLLDEYARLCPHPARTDLIYWPMNHGLPQEMTPEEIVEIALSYAPIELGPPPA